MTSESYRNMMLTLIALLLLVLAARPSVAVKAQPANGNWYVEPGSVLVPVPDGMGQVQGKVIINLQNGDIWGFPTNSMLPYPADPFQKDPPVVKPVYLGRFDFAAAHRD